MREKIKANLTKDAEISELLKRAKAQSEELKKIVLETEHHRDPHAARLRREQMIADARTADELAAARSLAAESAVQSENAAAISKRLCRQKYAPLAETLKELAKRSRELLEEELSKAIIAEEKFAGSFGVQ